jgi:gliding motility-associated protein GldL
MAFYEKYWWKKLIHKIYSWGASIVLVGALFKITHWPGATIMLTVGLLTEAFIFFMSGLEPPPEEYDWTLVFPELAGLTEEELMEQGQTSGREKINQKRGVQTAVQPASVEALEKFEAMLEKAGEGGLFEKLHDGLEKLNNNVAVLKDLTDAGVVTEEFNTSVKQAAEKAKEFSDNLVNSAKTVAEASEELADAEKKSADNLTYAAENAADSFNKMSQTIEKNNEQITNAYNQLAESMKVDFSMLTQGNEEYNKNITQLNKNLSAINAIFEVQLEEANLEDMLKKITDSAQYADKYSKQVIRLTKQLEALNDVYGRMLAALNVKVD